MGLFRAPAKGEDLLHQGLGALAGACLLLAQIWLPSVGTDFGIVPVVLVIMTYLGQEFARRALFAQRDRVGGFIVDLTSYGLQFLVLVLLIVLHDITFRAVLWVTGLTSLASCMFGFIRAHPSLVTVTRSDISATWRQHLE